MAKKKLLKKDKKLIYREIIDKRFKEFEPQYIIIRWLEDEYGVSNPYAYDIYKEAMVEVTKAEYSNIEDPFQTALEQTQQIMKDALNSNNKKIALEARKEMNKLLQLYIEKIEISGELVFKTGFINDDDTDTEEDNK